MSERRGLTIYFIDGTKMKLDFPKQTADDNLAAMKIKQILAARQLVAEVDGVALVFPFENIKYIEAHPAPAKLPEFTIRGATISSGA